MGDIADAHGIVRHGVTERGFVDEFQPRRGIGQRNTMAGATGAALRLRGGGQRGKAQGNAQGKGGQDTDHGADTSAPSLA